MNGVFRLGLVCAAISFGTIAVNAQTLTDARGRPVKLTDGSRIVSVGGAVTEILYALGAQDKIVGVDTTSLYPPQAMKEKASVGYMRQLSAEGVLGLRPSLILSIEGAGPRETIGILDSAGISLVTVSDTFSGEGIVEKIRIIAAATGSEASGRCLIDKVRADLEALPKALPQGETSKRVIFVISLLNGRAMVAGRKTAADAIIHMAGGVNAFTDYDGYKPVSDEAIVAAKPDVVLTMERGGADAITPDKIFAMAAFAATPAAAQRSLVAMDGLYLLGFGPRTAGAVRELTGALYPKIKLDRLPSEQRAAGTAPCGS